MDDSVHQQLTAASPAIRPAPWPTNTASPGPAQPPCTRRQLAQFSHASPLLPNTSVNALRTQLITTLLRGAQQAGGAREHGQVGVHHMPPVPSLLPVRHRYQAGPRCLGQRKRRQPHDVPHTGSNNGMRCSQLPIPPTGCQTQSWRRPASLPGSRALLGCRWACTPVGRPQV